ncbi:MAG: hypothetical protein EBX52_05290 [Proteobacteria bacterium]|nr:hypothetical protein [Pseudomonadota bacterium]
MKATLSRFNLILVLAWAVSAWTVSACSPSRPAPPPEPLAVKTLNRIVYDSKGSPDLSYSISNSEDGTPNVEILRYENSSKRGLTIEIPNGELKTKLKALFQGGVEVDSDPVRKDPATLILTYASGEVLTLESPRIKTAGAESLITDLNAVLLLKIGKYTESSGTGSPGTHTPTGSSPTPPTTSTSISTGVETHPGPPVIESGPARRTLT